MQQIYRLIQYISLSANNPEQKIWWNHKALEMIDYLDR